VVGLPSTATWEDIINWITIPGHHRQVRLSARRWSDVLHLIQGIDRNLVALTERVRTSFAGEGVRALVEHLNKIHESLDKIHGHHYKIGDALGDCAETLAAAVQAIKVPDWVVVDVVAKQAEYAQNGRFTPFRQGEFWERARGFETAQHLYYEWVHGWISTDVREAHTQLESGYRRADSIMPDGTPVSVPGAGSGDDRRPPGPGTADRRGLGDTTMPNIPVGAAGLGSGLNNAGLTSGLSTGDLGTANLDGSDLGAGGFDGGGGLAGFDPSEGRLGPLVGTDAMTGATSNAGGMSGSSTGGARLAATGPGGLASGASGLGVVPAGFGAGGAPVGPTGGEHETALVEDDRSIFGPRRGDEGLPTDVIG
jgi:hypothetical protein